MRELGDTRLPTTGAVLTDPRSPRNTGLFTGYGGNQNIVEREGADPSDLQAARGASDMPTGQEMVDEITPEDFSELINVLKALGVIAPEFDPNSLGGAGQTPSLEEMYARLLDMYYNAVGVQYGDPGGAGTGSDDSGTGTGASTDDEGRFIVDDDGNLIFAPVIPGVTIPNVPPPSDEDDDDGDDDAGGGGGAGGEEGGEAGASDAGGGDAGGSDSGGDDGSTDSGGGNLDQGDGEGEESTPQYYEVDEDGNVFIVDANDEDGFWDENGFWNGAWKRIGNINDGTGAWWEDFESGGIYGEHGELIIRPESDPDPDSDDDDDDDDDTTDITPDPDLFGGPSPIDPAPPITGGPQPPDVEDGDDEGPFTTDPDPGVPQTGGPQPPGGGGGNGNGTTDGGTDTGGGGDDTGGGGGGTDGGSGGGSGGGNGTGGDDGSGGDGSGGEGDGGDGSGDGSGGDGSGDGLGGGDPAFDPDKRFADLPFVVPDLYDVPQQRGMFLSQIAQPDSSLLLDDFFVRQMNRKGGMLV